MSEFARNTVDKCLNFKKMCVYCWFSGSPGYQSHTFLECGSKRTLCLLCVRVGHFANDCALKTITLDSEQSVCFSCFTPRTPLFHPTGYSKCVARDVVRTIGMLAWHSIKLKPILCATFGLESAMSLKDYFIWLHHRNPKNVSNACEVFFLVLEHKPI